MRMNIFQAAKDRDDLYFKISYWNYCTDLSKYANINKSNKFNLARNYKVATTGYAAV